jgi:Na+/melibiose symporter-like transporter
MVKFLDDRQKRTGWLMIGISAAYLVYFLKVRLLTAGLPIEKKEWIYFAGMILCLMMGTANVRLAMIRERRKLEQSDKTTA